MTRSELIQKLASNNTLLSAGDVELVVRTILDEISHALSKGGRVEIRGFGAFAPLRRSARIARNPKTGDTFLVPEKDLPHFKPGKVLRERVNASGKV